MPPLTAKNLPKIGKKREQIRKNRETRKNWKEKAKIGKVLSLSPLLTDRAGYANGSQSTIQLAPQCLHWRFIRLKI